MCTVIYYKKMIGDMDSKKHEEYVMKIHDDFFQGEIINLIK